MSKGFERLQQADGESMAQVHLGADAEGADAGAGAEG